MNSELENNGSTHQADGIAGGRILMIGFLLILFAVPAVDGTMAIVNEIRMPQKTFVEDFTAPYHPNRDYSDIRRGGLADTFSAPEMVQRYGHFYRYHILTDARGFVTAPGGTLENSSIVVIGDSFTLGPRTEDTLAELIEHAPGQPRGNAYNLGSTTNSILSFLILFPPLGQSASAITPRKHLVLTLCKRNLTGKGIRAYLELFSPNPSVMKKRMLLYRIKKYLPGRILDRAKERSLIIPFANSLTNSLRLSLGIYTPPSVTIVGTDDSLFFVNDVRFWKETHGDNDVLALGDGMKFLDAEAAKRGFNLLLVMVPDKSDVYPELLPKKLQPPRSDPVADYFRRIEKSLESRGVSVINLLPSFRTAAHQQQQMIYYPDDAHWNTRGKMIAVHSILSYLESESKNKVRTGTQGTR